MKKYHVILKIYGFVTPYSMKITTDSKEYWFYPDAYIKDIQNIDLLTLFSEKNFDSYKSWSEGNFIKEKGRFSYIGLELEFDLNWETKEVIDYVWDKIRGLILTLDYLFSNMHYIDSLFVFQIDNLFCRAIKINNINQYWSNKFMDFRVNLVEDLESLLSSIVNNIEQNEEYHKDFELFLRGKTFIEPSSLSPRKKRRDILDCLTDLWESLEHLSNIYWKKNQAKFNSLIKKDSKAKNKVLKILNMCKNIGFPPAEIDESLIKDIYKDYYNVKKHETSDYYEQRFDDLFLKLRKITMLIEKIFMWIFNLSPKIIELRNFGEFSLIIEPTKKKIEFKSVSRKEERKKELMRRPKYIDFIKYIEYESISEKILKTQSHFFQSTLKLSNLEKLTRIKSINNFEIKFEVYQIEREDRNKITFNEIYKVSNDYFLIQFRPLHSMRTPMISEDTISVNFSVYYLDIHFISNKNTK